MLTLKQIEKIETKIHAPLVGYRGVILSEQDEKNLRATAMASAKLSEKNKMLTNALNAAYKVIKEIIQSVLLLKYRFTEPNTPPCENLSEPQQTLIEAIRNFGKSFFKSYGHDNLIDELSKARLDGDISKNYSELVDERERKNQKSQPSFSEILETNRVKANEHNAQISSSRATQTKRKISGEER